MSFIWPIESCHLWWPWMTLKVIRLLLGLQMESVEHLCNSSHGFNWHGAVALSIGDSWAFVELSCNFILIHQSSRANGMKLYKEQCSVDARHQFFSNPIVDILHSLPAPVVLSPSVAVFKRNLAKLTFSSFYVTLNNMCLCVFMYFMTCILLRCKWPFGPFAFNKLTDWLLHLWLKVHLQNIMHLSPARLRGTATSAVVCLYVCQSVRVHVSKKRDVQTC